MFNPSFTAKPHGSQTLVTANGFLGETEMVIPITVEEFNEGMKKYKDHGMHIHQAFPTLSATYREFLISGMDENMQKAFFY